MMERFTHIDYFASEALGPLIAEGRGIVGREAEIARQAFVIGQAMVDERRTLHAGYHAPERVKARNLRKMAPELLEGVRMCVKAEKERLRKLKPGSPASTYAGRRIEYLEKLIVRALAG